MSESSASLGGLGQVEGLSPTIIEKYQYNLAVLKQQVENFASDPQNTPPDFVKAMIDVESIIELKHTDFSTEEKLANLGKLEAWYIQKGITFPNPEWLAKKRNALAPDKYPLV